MPKQTKSEKTSNDKMDHQKKTNMTKKFRLIINEIRSRQKEASKLTTIKHMTKINYATKPNSRSRRSLFGCRMGQIMLLASLCACVIGQLSLFVLANGQFLFTYEITNNNKDDFDNLRQNSFKNSLFDPSAFKIVTPSQLQSSYQKLASQINTNQAPQPTSVVASATPSSTQPSSSSVANLADLVDDAELDAALAPSPSPIAQPQTIGNPTLRSANSFRPTSASVESSNNLLAGNDDSSSDGGNPDDNDGGDDDLRGQKPTSASVSSATPAQTSFLKQTTAALQSFAELFSNFANNQANHNNNNQAPASTQVPTILQHQPQHLNGLMNQQQSMSSQTAPAQSSLATTTLQQQQRDMINEPNLAANQQAEARSLHDHWTQEQQRAYTHNQQQLNQQQQSQQHQHRSPISPHHHQSLKFTIQGPQSNQQQHHLAPTIATQLSTGSALKSFTTTPSVSLQNQLRFHNQHQQNPSSGHQHQHPFPLGANQQHNHHQQQAPSHVAARSPQHQPMAQQHQQQQANSQAAYWLTANPLTNSGDGNYLVEIKQPGQEQQQPEVSTATLMDNLLAVGHQRAQEPINNHLNHHQHALSNQNSLVQQNRPAPVITPSVPSQAQAPTFVPHLKAPVSSSIFSTTMPTTLLGTNEITSTQSSPLASQPSYFGSNPSTSSRNFALQPPINIPENYRAGVSSDDKPVLRKSAQETLISYRLERQNGQESQPELQANQPLSRSQQPSTSNNYLQENEQSHATTTKDHHDEAQPQKPVVMTRQAHVEQPSKASSDIPQVSPQIYESFLLQQRDQHEKHMELLKQQLELNKLLEQKQRERAKAEDDEDSKRIVKPKTDSSAAKQQHNSNQIQATANKKLQAAQLQSQQTSAAQRQAEQERARKLEYESEEKRRLADELETAQRVALKNKRDREEREQRERSELAARRQRYEDEAKQRRVAAEERRRQRELAEQREREQRDREQREAAEAAELERERVRRVKAEQEAAAAAAAAAQAAREREIREREAREHQEQLEAAEQLLRKQEALKKREQEEKLALEQKQAYEKQQLQQQSNKRARFQQQVQLQKQQKQQSQKLQHLQPEVSASSVSSGGWGTPIGNRAARAGLNSVRPSRASPSSTTTTTSSTTTTTESTPSTASFMSRQEYIQTTPPPYTTIPVQTTTSTTTTTSAPSRATGRSQQLGSEIGEKYRTRSKKTRNGAGSAAGSTSENRRLDDKQIREKIPLYSGPGQYGLYRNESVARSELAALLESVSLPANNTPPRSTSATTTPMPTTAYANETSDSQDNSFSTSLSPLLQQSNRIELQNKPPSRRTNHVSNPHYQIDSADQSDDVLRRSKAVISRSSRNAAVTAATPTSSTSSAPSAAAGSSLSAPSARSRSSWRPQPTRGFSADASNIGSSSDLISSMTTNSQDKDSAARNRPARIGLASLPPDSDNDGIPGRAGIEYPVLEKIPQTSFTCSKQPLNGYYADTETACQVVHLCQGGVQSSILCPNGTIFNQEKFSCQWWYEVNCSRAPMFYQLNDNLYKQTNNKLATSQEFNGVGEETSDSSDQDQDTPKSLASSSSSSSTQNQNSILSNGSNTSQRADSLEQD